MKNNLGKRIAVSLALALLLTPIFWLQGVTDAYAATPSFKDTKLEIIGDDETYQLDVKNKVDGSKYKWSSSNTKVARVSSKGLVTSVGKGTAKIKCKITYPSKKTKTLTCKVTVVIPATKVEINNATEVNGAHIILLGETFDFNRDIVPSNSSDKTYWSIAGGDAGCIKVTNSKSGIVEAVKPGKVILKATAARTATEEDAAKSIVDDAIIIEVVGPSATVNSAEIIDSTVIKVVFDSPIDASTVIGTSGALADSIAITLKSNIKGVLAADPGKLKAELSTDKKTLTITSTNSFEGEYGINFTNKIKTTEGVIIEDYYKQLSYVDNKAPHVIDTILDDSGMIATIKFNEAIDFSGLKVSNASVVPGTYTTSIDPQTASFMTNKNNYLVSEDKRSLTINLSSIAASDFNKLITVTITGIKDMSGNMPVNYTLPVFIRADNTPKAQARLINIERSGYNTLTAYFDRAIQVGGYASISGGSSMVGVVDEKNPNKVYYTITESDALKTGVQSVTVSYWNSYNVNPNDTTSYQQHERKVNFDVDRTSPVLLNHEFDGDKGILTLTYNTDVILNLNSGTFNATLVTVNEEIRSNNSVYYTKMASQDPKVIKLQLSNMVFYGNYTFTISKDFATDNFRNKSATDRVITISNTSGADLELPGPYSVTQSTVNPSQIYLEFANRLDVASAQNVANYTIPGVTITSAQVINNTNESGATVVLTVVEGSIDITIERPIKISRVTSYSGTYTPISSFETIVSLRDNKKPYYISYEYDRSKTNEIRLNFNEEIKGTMRVKVTQISNTLNYELGNTVTISGSKVIITLNTQPVNNSLIKIEILENAITDASGNLPSPMSTQIHVPVNY